MTFQDAAKAILRDTDEALTAQEITHRALERGLIRSRGKTPVATMNAALYGAADDTLVKESRPGKTRAARGSVRWRLVE